MSRKESVKKGKRQTAGRDKPPFKRIVWIVCAIVTVLVIADIFVFHTLFGQRVQANSGAAAAESTPADTAPVLAQTDPTALFDEKAARLQKQIFENSDLSGENAIVTEDGTRIPYACFLSLSNTEVRATVITGTGASIADAWANAVANARAYVDATGYKVIWLKADLVTSMAQVSKDALKELITPSRDEFFRIGIALDTYFRTAFLEQEINSNKLIDYDNDVLDLDEINKYLKHQGRLTIGALPNVFTLFTCLSWFCDETDQVYELYQYDGEGLDYGRRIIDGADKSVVDGVLRTSTKWLANDLKADGTFVYGYYPTYDNIIPSYNILRHTTTIHALLWAYEMYGDEALVPKIESALRYVVEQSIKYDESGAAFIVDRANGEIKLGGNAIAIMVLDRYQHVFGTKQYQELCVVLGNGILSMMDVEKGTYTHVLNEDLTEKDEYRIIYYDGEATYALAILYGMTKDETWLNAAKAAVEHFISADYTQYRDHWVAYAVNEITKYIPDERYFEFGLKNAQVNLEEIYYRDTSYHTYLELLMCTFELYDRARTNNIPVAYLEEFDDQAFIETIFHRAEHMLNGYLYPEYAMYLKYPNKIVGTFCVRHDGYRIRIDDMEHFIAGYYHYLENYDKLVAYRQ